MVEIIAKDSSNPNDSNYIWCEAQVRGQDRMGGAYRLDLWIGDGGCADRLPNAQPWVAVGVLHYKA